MEREPVRSVKGFAAAVKAAELPVNGLHLARRAQKQQDALQGRFLWSIALRAMAPSASSAIG